MKVKNRSASVSGYTIPDLNVRRRFAPGEVKDVPKEELEKLLYQPGGADMFYGNLQVSEEDLRTLHADDQEPEYFYSEEDVKRVILHGSLDEFMDMIDFAPDGVLEIIKSQATALPMTDMNKAEAFKKKTGYDVMKAVSNLRAVQNDTESAVSDASTRKRRVEIPQADSGKYKIVNQ